STRLADLTISMLVDAGMDVISIDKDPARCRRTAGQHPGALVICDDPTNPQVIQSFDPDENDAILGLTGWDEVNVLSCLVGKALGVGTAVARFNRIDYVGLLSGVGIDAAVSARLVAAGEILRFVRRGRIHSVVTFNDTDAEVIDIEVENEAVASGSKLIDLDMPRNAVIGGIVRDGKPIVPTGATSIEPGDRVIVFSMPGSITTVERLFAQRPT
ncbi:MAG: NAD-binding protein, partial [Acidimicrobiia bacterium]|nr:NAD-binding protein [Acidimicrobiia bacterium]